MDESAKAAENVRNSLQTFRNRSVVVGAQDKCTHCGTFLLLKPFFLFPCSHKFHADCLEKKLMELLRKFKICGSQTFLAVWKGKF
jgi:hypothetical protein